MAADESLVDELAQLLIPRLDRIAALANRTDLPANGDPWYTTRKRLRRQRRYAVEALTLVEAKAAPLWERYKELAEKIEAIDTRLAQIPSPDRPGDVS